MKIPYGWIREFVALEITAAEAADRLVNAGIEVASVTRLAPEGLRGVVIGEIEAIERELGESHGHRLVLCRVSTGRERFSVVCGAPNVAVGARAAFAPPGATLPGGRTVAKATIRGTASEGMLCSERELGFGEEHEAGLLLLEPGAPVGADLVAHLGLDDSVLEIEITPNRPDCLSVVGVARELGALTGAPFRHPEVGLKETGEPATELARVRVEAPDLAPRYTIRVISDLRIAPSPSRLAARLRAAGLRPISNVVDVTNYVMWELGQPLHAFDAAAVAVAREAGRALPTIVVRRARDGERLTTLDGQERRLDPGVLLIADSTRGIGLAGVMGGENTEVSAATTRVLLESAYFDPACIRRTSRVLGLRTDAAYRFERGADIEGLVDASDRAAQLMAELAGGVVARGFIDAYPSPRPRPRVRLRMARVQRLLGVAPPRAEARRILAGLGLAVIGEPPDADALDVEIPSFRRDLLMEDDLVEEVIRIWGYDRIPSTLPGGAISLVRLPASHRQAQRVRLALVGAGLCEAVTYSFSDPARAATLEAPGGPEPLALLNPLSQDASLLRRHPLEGLLGVVATNLRRRQPNVRVFEIAETYVSADGGTREPRWAALALTGLRHDPAWYASPEPVDVYDAKGMAEHVLLALGVTTTRDGAGRLAGFEPDCHGALVAAGGSVLAEFGEVRAEVRAAWEVGAPVFAAVVALDAVAALPLAPGRYQPPPRFPSVQRDVAFAVGPEQNVSAAEIEAALRQGGGPLLRDVRLFDVFHGPPGGGPQEGGCSLAWRLTFQAEDRTLTDDEINALHERLIRRVVDHLHITWRGV